MMRRLWWAILVTLVLAPAVAAVPGDGDLRLAGTVRLPGSSTLQPTALSFTAVAETGSALTFEGAGTAVVVDIVRYSEDVVSNPAGAPIRARGGFTSESHTFREATLSVRESPEGAIAALTGDGLTSSRLLLHDVRLQGVDRGILYPGLQTGGPSTSGTGGEAVEIAETVELAASRLEGTLAGGFVLRLDGSTLEVSGSEGTTTFLSGTTSTPTSPATSTATVTLLVVSWRGEAIVNAAGGALAAYTTDPVTTSALEAAQARGILVVDGERHALSGEALGLGGTFDVRPRPGTTPAAPDGGPVAYTSDLAVDLGGDFERVSLNAATTRAIFLPATLGAIVAGALVAAVAWYWPLAKYAVTAAYTRLKQPELLDNEVRERIYGIIKGKPGISARSVHRESGQSWGTVVYHLRQLERHRLVKSMRVGRFRTFYESNGRYNGHEDGLAVLHNDRTRGIARLVAANPGITQEQLTKAAGLPQSTVSYYVRKLKQARLVDEQRNGKYAAYFASDALPAALAAVGTVGEGSDAVPVPTAV